MRQRRIPLTRKSNSMDGSTRRFYEDLSRALDQQVDAKNIRVDAFRTNAPGPEDRFESHDPKLAAIRITDSETGRVVVCAEYTRQIENKIMAMLQLITDREGHK